MYWFQRQPARLREFQSIISSQEVKGFQTDHFFQSEMFNVSNGADWGCPYGSRSFADGNRTQTRTNGSGLGHWVTLRPQTLPVCRGCAIAQDLETPVQNAQASAGVLFHTAALHTR